MIVFNSESIGITQGEHELHGPGMTATIQFAPYDKVLTTGWYSDVVIVLTKPFCKLEVSVGTSYLLLDFVEGEM